MVLPFKGEQVEAAAPLNEREVLAAGSDGSLAVCDASTGQVLRRAKSEERFPKLRVLRGGQRFLLLSQYKLWVWCSDPLELETQFNGWVRRSNRWQLYDSSPPPAGEDKSVLERWREERRALEFQQLGLNPESFRECADGKLLIGRYFDLPSGSSPSYGIYRIDPSDWSLEPFILPETQAGILNYFRGFSPSGRYAIRSDYLALPYTNGRRGLKGLLGLGSGDGSEAHRDAKWDGKLRFGQTLELWDLAGEPKIAQRPMVRMIEHGHMRGNTLGDGFVGEDRLLSLAEQIERIHNSPNGTTELARWFDLPVSRSLRLLHDTVQQVYWEPEERAFWVQFHPSVLRRVSLEGNLSPLISFARWSHEGDPYAGPWHGCRELGLEFLSDGRLRFGSPRDGFVCFDPAICMEQAGDIHVFDEDEDGFEPPHDHGAAFDAFVNKATMVEQPVESFTAAGVEVALSSLTEQVETRLADLIWGEYLRVRFELDGEDLSEESFYQRIVEQDLPVGGALRKLILAYLDGIEGGEGKQPWSEGEEGIAAFGHAVRALVLLDPGFLDVLRLYMTKRDGEHECFCGDVILPDFLKRYGWRDPAVLGFGVFFAINRIWGGRVPESLIWNEYGLIDAASGMMKAEAFANLVLAELRRHDLDPQWNHQEPKTGYYLSTLIAGLDQADRYHKALRAALEEKCPEAFV